MPAETSFESRLERIYPGQGAELGSRVRALVNEYRGQSARLHPGGSPWSERDVVLITYPDQLRSASATPLATFTAWLRATGLDQLLSTVHLLPFCPYSSDDGFSVIDYLSIDPEAGDWNDIAGLGERVDLMFDLVLNHISRHSDWFRQYLAGAPPYDQFFIEADPALDYRQVVRPRNLPLLTPVETERGVKHLWTTFSDDQIDLNYANPEVLLRMLRVLLEYCQRGARIVRLDAIAFLWKVVGTNCLHLPETHEVVKLMRDVTSEAFPGTLMLTETNVPHAENISYFGRGDEAHMVYQFSLPPLLLDAFTSGDAVYLRRWLETLDPPPAGCTFFNFTASHDGIGVRPLEGLVPDDRFERVVRAVQDRGGLISTRTQPDGTASPYELNITFVDALSPTVAGEPADSERHMRQFLTSQAVMLSLPGIPAVYFHSLVGTRNDYAAARDTGINRRINRHKYELQELEAHLQAAETLAPGIYAGYRTLLATRRDQPAFHPEAPISLIGGVPDSVLALLRTSLDGEQQVFVAANFGHENVVLRPAELVDESHRGAFTDLFGGAQREAAQLPPGGFVWLQRK